MVRNMGIAEKLGYLRVPEDTVIDLKDVDKYPEDRIVLMSTGSQGEPMAALSRMASGDHKIQIQQDDLVILASSLIPGNENSVFRVINGLMKLGAHVVHKGNAKVHVSGHASEGELLYCYNIVQPRYVMPIHGEVRHILANGRIAEATGVPAKNILTTGDGVVVDMHKGKAKIVGEVPVSYVYVDGTSIGEITDDDLKSRRVLGEEGFVSVIVVINRQNGTIVSGPDIHARGVAEDDDVFETVKPKIIQVLEKAAASDREHTNYQLQQVIRRAFGSWVSRKLRRRPMIVPIVIEA